LESRYITSAAKAEQLPPFDQPEIAMIGRSNTGKSSLINSLLQRRQLARTSRTPGRTQMVNFFGVNDAFILADLPGYGYSSAGTRVAKHWQPLVETYMRRPNIVEFLFLLDIRRKLTEEDLELMYMISRQIPPVIVLTKADKLSNRDAQAKKKQIVQVLGDEKIETRTTLISSSLKGTGINALRKHLFEGEPWS
jgi:GTP-binding protein